jgi:ABC-2 type transport system ATP-binding protein
VGFYGRLAGVPARALEARVSEVLAEVGLTEAAGRRVGTYSQGMRQRLGLAQALVHDPPLLILDEPTAALDPLGAAEIGRLLLALKARGKTILLSSHLLAQVEDWCDRIAILHRGRLLLEGPVADLLGRRDQQAFVVETLPENELAELRGWLGQRGRHLLEVGPPRSRLDALFLAAVGQAERERDATVGAA